MNRYRTALHVSQRIGWTLEDVLPETSRLDLTRSFLPEALAQVEQSTFLCPEDRLRLNQIRGYSYLQLFGLVEEFILPFVWEHAQRRFGADDYEVRALLQFASEEAKHIHLFKRFAARFEADWGAGCRTIGPAPAIGEAVLAHHPLGVALVILRIEWMTQTHYVEAVRDEAALDPLVRSLLKHHWLEEAQHARLDGLIVEQLASQLTRDEVQQGLADFARIGALLADGLERQVELDLDALEIRRGAELRSSERQALRDSQRRAYGYTFHESGAQHPRFVAALERLARH